MVTVLAAGDVGSTKEAMQSDAKKNTCSPAPCTMTGYKLVPWFPPVTNPLLLLDTTWLAKRLKELCVIVGEELPDMARTF